MSEPIWGDYYEKKGSEKRESADIRTGSWNYVRIFVGSWSTRFNFIREYLDIASIGNEQITLGVSHPEDNQAYPTIIDITGVGEVGKTDIFEYREGYLTGETSNAITYEKAIITVTYSRILDAIDENVFSGEVYKYITEEYRTEIEVIELNDANIKVNQSSADVNNPVRHIYHSPLLKISYTVPYYFMPAYLGSITNRDVDEVYRFFDVNGDDITDDIGNRLPGLGDVDDMSVTPIFMSLITGMCNSTDVFPGKFVRSINGSNQYSYSQTSQFKAKTLKFDGITLRSNQAFENVHGYPYSAVFNFSHKPIGWDKKWDVNDSGEFVVMSIDPPIVPAFIRFDQFFNGLFY